MPEDFMLQEAIAAIRQHKLNRARDLLTRLLKVDKENPLYWLWLSTVVETGKERAYCLQMVLRLDPNNDDARRGLVMMGALPAAENRKPLFVVPRKWEVKIIADAPHSGLCALWANPVSQLSLLAVIGMVVVVAVIVGIVGTEKKPVQVVVRRTRTPAPLASYTPTPTYLGYVAPVPQTTPVLASSGPTPLWMMLEATYTPTPFYVSTPHVISGEAYRAGEIALTNGNWQEALTFFEQASKLEPDAPDILYYLGEAHRLKGNYIAAISAYNQAISVNRSFAPAYLGKTRARLAADPKAEIDDDLDRAIEFDPNLAEAYLERIDYFLAQGDVESSLQDLVMVEKLLPHSPWPYLYRAQILMEQGDARQALEAAQRAFELDQTLLPVYKVYGEAALLGGDYDAAADKLAVYVQFRKKDAWAWLALGKAHARLASDEQVSRLLAQGASEGDYRKALDAFEQGAKLNDKMPGLTLQRGCVYLALGEGQKAVNDLLVARQEEAANYTGSAQSPLWFALNIGLGRALLEAERYQDAYKVIDGARNQIESEEDKAAFYYWRATALEAMGNRTAALRDWKALTAIEFGAVPQQWQDLAEEKLAALSTTQGSQTPSATPPSPTALLTGSGTPTPSPAASPDKTAAKSATSQP
ncbi:MAG: tetratricopeptide repeat protein [Anaerolineales bacterium]|nr:tetratricopeptide repeat protein [Anaerolineales bacterium]